MGCGGSKEDVATGNTIIHRRLLRRKPEPPKAQTTTVAMPEKTDTNLLDNASKPVLETFESNKETEQPPAPETINKETKQLTIEVKDANEQGKLIANESQEEYFSSRKSVETVLGTVVEGVVAGEGVEYYSPDHEPNNLSGKDEKEGEKKGSKESESIDGVEALDKGNGLVGSGGEAAPKEKDGKLGNMDSTELKEAIVVEETKDEKTNIEQKSLGGEVIESK